MEFKSKYIIENEINQEISELKTLVNIFTDLFTLLKSCNGKFLIPSYGRDIKKELESRYNIFIYFKLDRSNGYHIEICFAGEHYRFELSIFKFDYDNFYAENKLKLDNIKQDILKLEKFILEFDSYYETYHNLMTGFYKFYTELKKYNALNFFEIPYINDLNKE